MATDLQVTTNKLSNKETQLTVKVPVEKIQNKVEGRISQVAKTAKIDGFRKGKVPMSHIRSQYGAGIQQEVINDVIRDPQGRIALPIRVEAWRIDQYPAVESWTRRGLELPRHSGAQSPPPWATAR